MTNPNLTLIGVVLDRSGSMAGTRAATINGFNELMDGQRKGPGEAVVYLSLFNHAVETVHRMAPIGIVPPLNTATYVPGGNTALHDAIGHAITDIGFMLATTPEHDRPGKVIIAIMTDGEENASGTYHGDRIKEMIGHQRDTYAWEFLFMGANQDAVTVGTRMGIRREGTITYSATNTGIANTVSATNSYVACLRSNQLAAFSDTDRASAQAQDP